MRTRIVAVDGPGGAGKSSFAARLASVLGDCQIIHTDDFASWDNPVDWWPTFLDEVLVPLAAGASATFTPTSWDGLPKAARTIRAEGVVILEGVTASRAAFRPFLTYAIWIETPRDLRLRRGIERDGEAMRTQWQAWMAAEDRYAEEEHPERHADLVLPGDEDLWL